jgi:hypothetical protein
MEGKENHIPTEKHYKKYLPQEEKDNLMPEVGVIALDNRSSANYRPPIDL